MYIQNVYMSNYAKTSMIKGTATIELEPGKLEINFNDAEREMIHTIIMGAFARVKAEQIRKLQEETPDILRLAPPEPELVEDADFSDVEV